MRRTRTAPLITPFTCREREGEVGKLYLPGTFLTFSPCRIATHGPAHGRPVPTPWLVSSSFFIRCHAVAMLYGR